MSSPRVFISYSRDSTEHCEAVLQLAQRLRKDGIDAWYDGFEQAPSEGWTRWRTAQVQNVDFVLLVCTAAYQRRFDGVERPDIGQDETFEGLLLSQLLREGGARNYRLVPVQFEDAGPDYIPLALRPFARYTLPGAYDALIRHLTGQPDVVPEPLGSSSSMRSYLEWLAEQPSGLDLIGIGGGDVRLDLEEVYVPLRVGYGDIEQPRGEKRELLRASSNDDRELTEIFVGFDCHVLLLGGPGSGKTTALRELVQKCRREGPVALHLSSGYVPVFARLRRFRAEDLTAPLSVFIQRELREVSGGALNDATLTALCGHGQILLLLDGLDEIADDSLRAELCGYLTMQLKRNENHRLRVVVSSRLAGHDGVRVRLDDSFAHWELRPLDAKQVGDLVHRWFAEASKCLPRFSLDEARRQAETLVKALADPSFGQRLQVMFSTPLLLTLLCVVVQQGREMPRNRAAFYEECLRVLLSRWRAAKGLPPLLDVDTALALLRPLAYELHRAGRREDVSEDDLVEHLYRRLTELGRGAESPLRVLEWLHRDAGVISSFAPGQYGFFHLGIQEYLAALHIAGGNELLLDALASDFDEKWWHEVARLLVSMPARNMFGPLMRRLLAGPALLRQASVLRECLLEAAEVDVEPFIERLELVQPLVSPAGQVEILRLLLGRSEPALLRCAKRLTEVSHDPEVRAMAERVLASAARATSNTTTVDTVIIASESDLTHARVLAERLRAHGLSVWPGEGPPVPAHDLRISQVETVRVALVLVGAESPWQAKQAMIRMFRDTRQVVGVHLPGASKSPETMDGSVESWIDLREGFQAEGLAVLCSKILPAAVQEPVPGEVWVEPTTGIRFVYVPAGNFEMGRDDGTAEEQPQHSVQMSAFWLGETPVTNNQYARFRAEEGHREPALWRSERFSDPSQPVVGIDWNDALAFCAWLSRAAKVEVKLPSEAQWEYAARGTDRRVYPWGNEPPNPSLACFTDSGVDALPPVGSYPEGRGPFGALDQAGTVWEWCEDVWNKKIYSTRVAGAVLDPVTTTGDPISRVLRGGSWYNGDMALAAATRVTLKANYRDGSVGLRVVVPVRHPRP